MTSSSGTRVSRTSAQRHEELVDRRLRILFFAPKQCWPLDTGAKLRNYHLARELSNYGDVTYLGFSDASPLQNGNGRSLSDGKPQKQAEPQALLKSGLDRVITVPREKGYTVSGIVRGIWGETPLNVLNYTTPAMEAALKALLESEAFDLVQMESLLLSSYLPAIRSAAPSALVVCDWHNIDSEVIRRYSEYTAGVTRRWYARESARRMAELERKILTRFDGHITVSERDRSILLESAPDLPVSVVENGVDIRQYSDLTDKRKFRVLFVGSMDYHANIDAVTFFVRNVWPKVRQLKPDLIFTIVGRNPAREVRQLANLSGIEVTGTVADVRPFYSEAHAVVAPLRVGGGSRLKILEALAAGVPVVSTTLGAEGLAVKHQENILLADTPEHMSNFVNQIIQNAYIRQKLSNAGRLFVGSRHDWKVIGDALYDSHVRLLERFGRLARRRQAARATTRM